MSGLERYGRGFLRSGPDDAEDDDPAEDEGIREPCNGAYENVYDQSRWCAAVSPPAIYSTRVAGHCCDPVIPDGSRVTVDSEASFGPGDFVVSHHDAPNTEGGIASKLKQLVTPLRASICLPMVGAYDFSYVLSASMLNPRRPVYYDTGIIHAVHKVVRIEQPRSGAGAHV